MVKGFGKYDVYAVSGSIYCYRDTNVLKNRFGLRDYEKLKKLAAEKHLKGLDFEALADRSAYYFAELNYIHPFREGNGRAAREFMRQLYAMNGYEVDWAAVPAETLLAAMETSVFDTTDLKDALLMCLN